jgi:hypothetical protein
MTKLNTWAQENDWIWPKEVSGWECQTQDIPVEIFEKQMLHHWNNPGHQTTSRKKATEKRGPLSKFWLRLRGSCKAPNLLPLQSQDLGKQPRPILRTVGTLNTSVSRSTVDSAGISSTTTKGYSVFSSYCRAIFPSRSIHPYTSDAHVPEDESNDVREVDLEPSQYWVFHSTPKKLKGKLVWPPNCLVPPPGWGICIEEKFRVTWCVFVSLSVIPIISLCFAVGWWAHHGPTMFGVVSATFGAFSFTFVLWVAIMKDIQA